jgi:Protein of unknown function (DUF2961)
MLPTCKRLAAIAVTFFFIVLLAIALNGCNSGTGTATPNEMFAYRDNIEPRWSSPENINGAKGAGGKENGSAKGHPYDSIPAGQSKELLNIQAAGIIQRIWITINDRTPEMLRSLRLQMFWDGTAKPAVDIPFGDFFGVGLGRTAAFENALFANAEGRSFISFIAMPFKTAARIVVVNESGKSLRNIFFDVDYSMLNSWNDQYLYFHACWRRDTATKLGEDFAILPEVTGRGRFLGVNMGVNANPDYRKSWFGEGEVKIYLDDDTDYPTLNGTGTEDYIGTAWGQGKFINRYSGCSIASDSLLQWAFYRYHIPDPVYFKNHCRVVIQQIGGDATDSVAAYQQEGAPLSAVTTDGSTFNRYYKKGSLANLKDTTLGKGWTNFYRRDDVSATAYFYLDRATNDLPVLQDRAIRIWNLKAGK